MSVKQDSERLDLYLVRHGLAESRQAAKELIAEGLVRVNDRKLNKGVSVSASDQVAIEQTSVARVIEPNPELAVLILYVDDAVLIANKPGSMPCHPLRAIERGTVMNGIAAQIPRSRD